MGSLSKSLEKFHIIAFDDETKIPIFRISNGILPKIELENKPWAYPPRVASGLMKPPPYFQDFDSNKGEWPLWPVVLSGGVSCWGDKVWTSGYNWELPARTKIPKGLVIVRDGVFNHPQIPDHYSILPAEEMRLEQFEQLLKMFNSRWDDPVYSNAYWIRMTKTEIPDSPKLPHVPHNANDAEKKELSELAADIHRLKEWALDYENNDTDVASKTAEQMWRQICLYMQKIRKIEARK